MRLFSFFKFLKSDKVVTPRLYPNEYVPAFWEDDYCQIEIVPFENKAFIQKPAGQIDELATQSKTNYGFTETFERGPMAVRTISKEIRVDYFENTLIGFQFQKAKHIRYDKMKFLTVKMKKKSIWVFKLHNFI